MRPYRIGIAVEVAEYAVHLHDLIDISRHDTVVVPFLGEIPIVVVGTLVRQEQCTGDIPLDGTLVGRKGEEQFVEAAHMLLGFCGSVL